MPGVNVTGKPSTTDIFLGRGRVLLATLDTTTLKPFHFRHVGNATAFSLNVESEKLEHQNSRSGVKAIDREITLSQKVGISLTLDEVLNFDNLAYFFSGTAEKGVANIAAAGDITDLLIHADAIKGRSYQLVDSNGNRLYDISPTSAHLTIKSGSGSVGAATTLVEGTSYEVDRKWGMVHLLSGGVHVDGHNLWFTYDSQGTEQVVDQVTMLTQSKTSVFLRFVGINPANSDKEILVDLHSVSLSADGELPLIGEEFATLTLVGVAERNETGYPTAPVGRVYFHGDA
jgi:hypothetical protein